MKNYTAPAWARTIYDLSSKFTEDFGGGPRTLKMAWVIDLHKVITAFIIYAMMLHFDHFSPAAWVYLGLHGSYGYCWLVKDFAFRDSSFERRVTWGGALMTYVVLIAWYWLLPYLFMSHHIEPSGPILLLAIAMHTFGITLMIAADCQKYYSLKYRQGLITEGVFRFTRNPNFLGEWLIYAAYAVLVNHWAGYLVLAYATVFFLARMQIKDESISRYPEWHNYAATSSRLIPCGLIRSARSLLFSPNTTNTGSNND